MTTARGTAKSRRYTRQPPEQTHPNRSAGNFYRTAEGPGAALGGVPLSDVNAAVISAVRMGYKVAEAQIDRSARLAKRLRDAGDQEVGPGSDRKSLDATERLVFRTMMSGLSWFESLAAAERGSPIRRLLEAQYHMMGEMFGLAPADKAQSSDTAPPDSRASSRGGRDYGPVPPATSTSVEIRHTGPEDERRPIRVARLEFVGGTTLPAPAKMKFFSYEKLESDPLEAEFSVSESGVPVLSIATRREAQVGLWCGAICGPDGLQLGVIEIML